MACFGWLVSELFGGGNFGLDLHVRYVLLCLFVAVVSELRSGKREWQKRDRKLIRAMQTTTTTKHRERDRA